MEHTARLTLALAASAAIHGALLAPFAFVSARLKSGGQQQPAALEVMLTSPAMEQQAPAVANLKLAMESLASRVTTAAKSSAPSKDQQGESGMDSAPQPLIDIVPDYPEGAFALGLSGKVEVEVWVDERGHVENARVIETTMADTFNRSALKAVHEMRFAPGMSGGVPVKISIRTVIVYDLK